MVPAEVPEPVGDATDVTGSFLADPSELVREPGEPPANLLTDEAPVVEPEPVGDATAAVIEPVAIVEQDMSQQPMPVADIEAAGPSTPDDDTAVVANRLAYEKEICEGYQDSKPGDVAKEVEHQTDRLETLSETTGIDLDDLPAGAVALSLQDDGSLQVLTVEPTDPAAVLTAGDILPPKPEPAPREADPVEDRDTGDREPDTSPVQPESEPDGAGLRVVKHSQPTPTTGDWNTLTMAEKQAVVAEINDALQRLAVAQALQRRIDSGTSIGQAVAEYCEMVTEARSELVGVTPAMPSVSVSTARGITPVAVVSTQPMVPSVPQMSVDLADLDGLGEPREAQRCQQARAAGKPDDTHGTDQENGEARGSTPLPEPQGSPVGGK